MARLVLPVSNRDHIRGPANAAITLVEYGDFECPFCGAAYWVLEELVARFRRDLRFVFRHFPLAEIHPHAPLAAEAAEAADAQGRFWEMHEQLFQNQQDLRAERLVAHATALGLDVESFYADLVNHRYRDRVRTDFMSGVRSGVNGTPTLYINDYRYDGPTDRVPLVRTIEAILGQLRPAAP